MLLWLLGVLGLTGGGIGIAALLGGGPWMLSLSTMVVRWVWKWLSHATLWQLVALGLLCLTVVQHFTLVTTRHERDSWHKQYTLIHAQLEAISTAKNVQRQVTRDRLVTVTRVIKEADGRAEKVESAPLPGGCRTPPEISQADL